jgi:16S rRNA C967 or C1407 C5-methylase (RsmB/RsmF family)
MLDLHWMRERVVSNEFHRDRLAVLRGGAKIQGDAWPDAADAKLAVAHSVPKWFAARLIEERGVEGASALAAALSQKAPLTVRRNALKCDSNETLMRALAAEDVPAKTIFGLERNSFARRARRAFVRLRAPALRASSGSRPTVSVFSRSRTRGRSVSSPR